MPSCLSSSRHPPGIVFSVTRNLLSHLPPGTRWEFQARGEIHVHGMPHTTSTIRRRFLTLHGVPQVLPTSEENRDVDDNEWLEFEEVD